MHRIGFYYKNIYIIRIYILKFEKLVHLIGFYYKNISIFYTYIFLSSRNYFWNKTLHVSNSSSVHNQEFFTLHTAMVYAIQVCWQLASRIRTEHFPDPARKQSANSVLILLTSCQQTCVTYTTAVCTVSLYIYKETENVGQCLIQFLLLTDNWTLHIN